MQDHPLGEGFSDALGPDLMHFAFTLHAEDVSGKLRLLAAHLNGPEKRKLLEVMGERLLWITRQNFGATGIARPSEWSELSSAYARRVKRAYATLDSEEGGGGHGALFRSMRKQVSDDHVTVSAGENEATEYASAHQYGEGHMPLRPYFPITGDKDNEKLTPHAEHELIAAAESELERIYKS